MPIKRDFKFGDDARSAIERGVDILAESVASTLGPKGLNVMIQKPHGPPLMTKDGVSVAKECFLPDIHEDMGAQIVREAAARTAIEAGDGTTTATVLAHAVYKDGLRLIRAGLNPVDIVNGIDLATEAVLQEIESFVTPVSTVEELASVATISANGDSEIGSFIAEAMDLVGRDGVITVEDSHDHNTTLTQVSGYQFDRGWVAPQFQTDRARGIAVLDQPFVLVTSQRLSNLNAIAEMLQVIAENGRSIVIIADQVEHYALVALIENAMKGLIKVCAVNAPGFAGPKRLEALTDIATLCGTRVFGPMDRLDVVTVNDLGFAGRVIVSQGDTTILSPEGDADAIEARIAEIRAQAESASSEYDREVLTKRAAALSGGVAVIRVGARTEVALKEKKARVEDALCAARAAAEAGIVPGGGVTLVRARECLNRLTVSNTALRHGVEIVYRACAAPLTRIVTNAGQDPFRIIHTITSETEIADYGWDGSVDRFGSMLEFGILDPAKVTLTAFKNAMSVARMLLTTQVMIAMREDPADFLPPR